MAAMTIKAIEAAKPGMHVDGGAKGLYLKVSDGGSRSWIYRFQLNGKRREMGLGTYPGKGAADARAEAATLATAVKAGIDPIEQRRAAVLAQQQAAEAVKVEEIRKVTTFAEVAKQFIDGKADGWKNPRHADQWRNTLATYCAEFNDKPVAEVGIDDVEAALRPIWLTKTETATRVLDRIVCVINYAADKGLRDGDATSWARRLRENRLPMLPKKRERVRHHPALPYARLPEFMAALRQSPGSKRATGALEFAILCASRSSEVRLATWQANEQE